MKITNRSIHCPFCGMVPVVSEISTKNGMVLGCKECGADIKLTAIVEGNITKIKMEAQVRNIVVENCSFYATDKQSMIENCQFGKE